MIGGSSAITATVQSVSAADSAVRKKLLVTKNVLLVEDNEDDVFFLQRAWKDVGVPNPLQVVRDGQQAVDYLAGLGKYSDRETYKLPCLVLLDWKLPYMMGPEVLRWLRKHPTLRPLPVLVFSSSSKASDIDMAYGLGCNAYLEKPTDAHKLVDLVKLIQAFWLATIRFPQKQVWLTGGG